MAARRGIFLAPFGELADPRRVDALAAHAEARGRGGFFIRLPRARPLLATISANSSSPDPAGAAAPAAGAFSLLSPLR